MKTMQTESWYHKKLQKYFEEHYFEFEHSCEWFSNPAINKWKFYIPEKKLTVTLDCNYYGTIVEEKVLTDTDARTLYTFIKETCAGFDSIYENYIVKLVTKEGLSILREQGLIEKCGSINGRVLYTLAK